MGYAVVSHITTSYTYLKRYSDPVTGQVVAQMVGRVMALLFHDRGTRRGEWSAARPGRT